MEQQHAEADVDHALGMDDDGGFEDEEDGLAADGIHFAVNQQLLEDPQQLQAAMDVIANMGAIHAGSSEDDSLSGAETGDDASASGEDDEGEDWGDNVHPRGGDVTSCSDSEDYYARALARSENQAAYAFEEQLGSKGCVEVHMDTAVQRGCLGYVLPQPCGIDECDTAAEHFQTADVLAFIPYAAEPRPSQPFGGAAPPAAVTASAVSGEAHMQQPSSSASAPPHADAPRTSVSGQPAGALPDGSIEVLIGGPLRLSVCRLPPADRPGPMRVVCSQKLLMNHYSITVSPDGRFIAAGGERGFLFIYAYVRGEPQPDAQLAAAGPLGTSTSTAAAEPQLQPQQAGGGDEDAEVARGRPSHAGGLGGRPPARLQRLATFAFPVIGGFSGMNNSLRFGSFGGALRLVVATQDGDILLYNVPAWDGSTAGLARLTPSAFIVEGLPRWTATWAPQSPGAVPEPNLGAQAPDTGTTSDNDDGRGEAAGTGSAAAPGSATAEGSPSSSGGGAAPPTRYWSRDKLPTSRPQPNMSTSQTPCFSEHPSPTGDGTSVLVLDGVPDTNSILKFSCALNCAEPSPNGQWLAVGYDEPAIFLVPAGTDYHTHPIEVLYLPLRWNWSPWGRDLRPGCQYCAWSPSSDKVAASSDALFAVCVFDVARLQLLFTFQHCIGEPCLALRFVPGHAGLLVHAHSKENIFFAHVDAPRTTTTRLRLKAPGARGTLRAQQQQQQQSGPGKPVQDEQEAAGAAAHGAIHAGGDAVMHDAQPTSSSTGSAGTLPAQQQPQGQAGQRQEGQRQQQRAAGDGAGVGGIDEAPEEEDEDEKEDRLFRQRERSRQQAELQKRSRRRPAILGLLPTPDGRLLVATGHELLTFQLRQAGQAWDRSLHPLMPDSYRAAVRTLLMLASVDPATGRPRHLPAVADSADGSATRCSDNGSRAPAGQPTGLWRLDPNALDAVMRAAAEPPTAWALQPLGRWLAWPRIVDAGQLL